MPTYHEYNFKTVKWFLSTDSEPICLMKQIPDITSFSNVRQMKCITKKYQFYNHFDSEEFDIPEFHLHHSNMWIHMSTTCGYI